MVKYNETTIKKRTKYELEWSVWHSNREIYIIAQMRIRNREEEIIKKSVKQKWVKNGALQ